MTLVSFWYVVLVLLWTGFLLLEGFDFGVGMLHRLVGRDEAGVQTAIRTIGPVWDGNEVWLIVVVAATFAAFPSWFATMLSGFYPVFLVVLVGLILRGVSFEFRSHSTDPRSRRLWSAALTVGSLVVPLGLGIVLGGLLGGLPIDSQQEFVGDVGDLFGLYSVVTGVTITLLCLVHGAAFLALRTADDLRSRALTAGRVVGPPAAVLVVVWTLWTRIASGNGVLLSVSEFGAVLAAIAAAVLLAGGREGAGFVATSLALAGVVVSLFSELAPRVMVSTLGAANDLTATGTASSPYTLGVMTVVLAVLLPVVVLYQWWAYRVFGGRVRTGLDQSTHPSGTSAEALVGGGRGSRINRPPLPRAGAGPPPKQPLGRLASWLLAWLAAWLIMRAVTAAVSADGDGPRGHV
ncbi:MAG: cydB [Pseudonocardia sp.]|nr:cydB [Pseudonocardia sp.]